MGGGGGGTKDHIINSNTFATPLLRINRRWGDATIFLTRETKGDGRWGGGVIKGQIMNATVFAPSISRKRDRWREGKYCLEEIVLRVVTKR